MTRSKATCLTTSAAKAGVLDRVIMATTRQHQSRATLDRYIQAETRWDDAAAGRVGL
ncbi:MAG: hypothetical protein JWM85_3379 [Acidimicrobiaceae bacterium]|nr:hypothetical protein [Acidimicrobiaceae bacterium]